MVGGVRQADYFFKSLCVTVDHDGRKTTKITLDLFATDLKLESPSPNPRRATSSPPPQPPSNNSAAGGGFNNNNFSGGNGDFSVGMSSSTPNSSADCQESEAAQQQAAKNAFLELAHQQHNAHLAATGGMPPHGMGTGGPYGPPRNLPPGYGQMGPQQHGGPGAYPFSHMPQNSYAAAAAAATIAGYHHLSPYPSAQCPSPPRDGTILILSFTSAKPGPDWESHSFRAAESGGSQRATRPLVSFVGLRNRVTFPRKGVNLGRPMISPSC